MLSVSYAECRYAECLHAECRRALKNTLAQYRCISIIYHTWAI